MPDDAIPAYEGFLVVDLSRRMSGAFAARLFADHGADVVMLEPPEGHPLRHEAPFLGDTPGLERSALHAYINWNKRSTVIGKPSAAERWIAAADVVITTDSPSGLSELPLAAMPSDAVHLSVTPYGLDGPLAEAPASNLTLNARSGWSHINAMRDEPPLTLPSRQSGYAGGFAGFVSAAAALRRRSEFDEPEIVDVREFEALTHTGYPWSIGTIYQGSGWSRGATGGRPRGEPGPLYDALDGRMNFGFGDWHNWSEAMELFNLPDQGAREDLQAHDGRYAQDLAPVQAGVARELVRISKWPLFHQLAKLRCISGVLQTVPELVENEQLASRRFIVETELEGRMTRASGNPHPMSPPSWSLRGPAPVLGDEVGDDQARTPARASSSTQEGGMKTSLLRGRASSVAPRQLPQRGSSFRTDEVWSAGRDSCPDVYAGLEWDICDRVAGVSRCGCGSDRGAPACRYLANGATLDSGRDSRRVENAARLQHSGVVQCSQSEQARDHSGPAQRRGEGTVLGGWCRSSTSSPRTSAPVCSPSGESRSTRWPRNALT